MSRWAERDRIVDIGGAPDDRKSTKTSLIVSIPALDIGSIFQENSRSSYKHLTSGTSVVHLCTVGKAEGFQVTDMLPGQFAHRDQVVGWFGMQQARSNITTHVFPCTSEARNFRIPTSRDVIDTPADVLNVIFGTSSYQESN